jgi:hypothetical protein
MVQYTLIDLLERLLDIADNDKNLKKKIKFDFDEQYPIKIDTCYKKQNSVAINHYPLMYCEKNWKIPTVELFLEIVEESKVGEYGTYDNIYDEQYIKNDSLIWVANWGKETMRGVVGISVEEDYCIIKTAIL